MRVLLTTWAWPSHLYALVPFGWAARLAGHEVLVASQPALVPEIARTGLPSMAVGHDVDAVSMVREYLLPKEDAGQQGAGTVPRTGNGPRVLEMLLAHADSMVDDLVVTARDWRADVVVYEPTALAGPIAAAAAGVPAVRHLFGPDLLNRARPLLPDALAPLAARHGVDGFDPFGVATIDPTPEELQTATDYPRLPMRYEPFNGSGRLAKPRPADGGRPRVCLTWGHTIAQLDPERFLVPWLLTALDGMHIDVVAAVSSAQVPLLGDTGRGQVAVDTPLWQLLPECDLVISHGGAGTTLGALRHGVPLLVMPALPDHVGHSARVVAAGVGEQLSAATATAGDVRESVRRLLDGQEAGAAAGAVRDRMLIQPSPVDVVAELPGRVGVATG